MQGHVTSIVQSKKGKNEEVKENKEKKENMSYKSLLAHVLVAGEYNLIHAY